MVPSDGSPPPDAWTRVRVVFGKRGRLRFLGQLDIGRTLERALRRSGLPVRFSEGFNPRIRMSFPCAAPTGMASSCELVEIQVRPPAGAPEVETRLGGELPGDLPVLGAEAVPPGERLRLEAAAYQVRARGDGPPLPSAEAVGDLLARAEVPAERRGRPVDLRPFLRAAVREGGVLRLRLRFADTGATVRPEDVMAALGADPAGFSYERIGMEVRLRRGGAEEGRSYGAA